MTILRYISRFIARAVRIHLQPDRATLEAGYQAATRESWRADPRGHVGRNRNRGLARVTKAEADTVGTCLRVGRPRPACSPGGVEMPYLLCVARSVPVLAAAVLAVAIAAPAVQAQSSADSAPVTDAMLQEPAPGRLADVAADARRVGLQPAGPDRSRERRRTAHGLVARHGTRQPAGDAAGISAGCCTCPTRGTSSRRSMRLPAISSGSTAVTCRTTPPPSGLATTNRNLAIYEDRIIDTSADGYVFALDAATGRQVWETRILDYETHPALQSSGPIIADGKVISGRSCSSRGGPDACVIVAHDAVDRGGAVAAADDSRARRAGGRDLGRRALRGAETRRGLDGPELRSRS